MVKPFWILLEQETMGVSDISWTKCKSASYSRPMPSHHHSVFLQAGCPSCRPTNSIKALKVLQSTHNGYYGIHIRAHVYTYTLFWHPFSMQSQLAGCPFFLRGNWCKNFGWLDALHEANQETNNTHTTVLQPFVRVYPGEPVPEETSIHSHPSCSSTILISFLHLPRTIASSLLNPRKQISKYLNTE